MRNLGILTLFILAAVIASCQAAPVTLSTELPAAISPTLTSTNAAAAIAAATPAEYTWHGITPLMLNATLPSSPSEASVLLGHPDSSATIEDARALADQFGMQGDIYTTGSTGFLVADGNRRLSLQSNFHFIYYPSQFNYWVSNTANQQPPDVEAQIAAFMQEYGFDMDYTIIYSGHYSAYFALPLSSDGFSMRFPHFGASGFQFRFDQDGIFSVDATLLSSEPVGSYGIISADEALQMLLSPDPKYGTLEGFTSPSSMYPAWSRQYPQDETTTLYGYLNSLPSAVGGEPLVSLDGYRVIGNTSGIPAAMPDTFVEATGHFHSEDGTDFFVLENWQASVLHEGLLGTLQQQGDHIVLVTLEHEPLVMPDIPADVPLPLEDVYAMGVTVGDTFEWNAFDLRMANGGGGGGGGGLGFYDLNLSGTPMPLPTLASPQQLQPQIGEQLDGLRGLINVTLINQPNGSQRAEYDLSYLAEGQLSPVTLRLQGEGLETLQVYQHLPVEIWGTVIETDELFGISIVEVNRFVVPFPDLQFQILRGTQQAIQVAGQDELLFTTMDGQSYVQVMPGGGVDGMLIGQLGDEILLEGLIVPDETYAGYPTVQVWAGAMATSPKNGEAMELEITANQPAVVDEPQPQVQEAYEVPTASIDNVELVYLIPYPSYGLPDTDFYIQPMWHFTGHYSSAEEFEVFVQALKPEYLSPEIVTVEPPG